MGLNDQGSIDAFTELEKRIATEGVDLSTKADQSDLNSTNAIVAQKQTLGEPAKLNLQTISTDTLLDPDIPFWALDATANPVTLQLPPIADVLNRQYCIFCIDASHVARVLPDGSDGIIGPNTITANGLIFPATGFCVVLVALQNIGPVPASWLAFAVTDPRVAATVITATPTSGDLAKTLPDAATSAGLIVCYKNTASAGHTLTVNPAGADTIDGAGSGVVLADGKTATFARQNFDGSPGSLVNWITIVPPV